MRPRHSRSSTPLPKVDIPIVRNVCLSECEADYLAFIDDDEIAPSNWLSELLETARETNAEPLLGPVMTIYKDNVPGGVKKGEHVLPIE